MRLSRFNLKIGLSFGLALASVPLGHATGNRDDQLARELSKTDGWQAGEVVYPAGSRVQRTKKTDEKQLAGEAARQETGWIRNYCSELNKTDGWSPT
ncbi:MAG: hypothetical protein NDJ90_01095 [Oligoflexia bacterium]|nr:hypothetical protein [Oligoflexia bacterium]